MTEKLAQEIAELAKLANPGGPQFRVILPAAARKEGVRRAIGTQVFMNGQPIRRLKSVTVEQIAQATDEPFTSRITIELYQPIEVTFAPEE